VGKADGVGQPAQPLGLDHDRVAVGDVVLTGTPGGVGMGMQPPLYLADGDTVVVEAEGLGRLANTIRFTH
jgi:2-keto-4-pentenoate hydratase/2-oxohepta-3-ene-1,7-dioic acid hydratase in catechol pathway